MAFTSVQDSMSLERPRKKYDFSRAAVRQSAQSSARGQSTAVSPQLAARTNSASFISLLHLCSQKNSDLGTIGCFIEPFKTRVTPTTEKH